MSYSDSDGNGDIDAATEIIEEKNYYPFGLQHKGYNEVVSANTNSIARKFGYNGIENEEALGLNLMEMDMRQYDAAIARWTGIDPVTHHSNSTYNAFDNNPIFWADPSGADAVYNWDDGKYYDGGKEVSFNQALASHGIDLSTDPKKKKAKKKGLGDASVGEKSTANFKFVKNRTEVIHYRNNPELGDKVEVAAYRAGSLASKVHGNPLKGGDNKGYTGALRHSYWMYLLAVELGPELAESLGTMHEDFTMTGGGSNMKTDDSKMDMINNAWGINMAKVNPNLNALDFEETFHNEVKKNNAKIRIIYRGTIPKTSHKKSGKTAKAFLERRANGWSILDLFK